MQILDTLLRPLFFAHDLAAGFLARRLAEVKVAMLLIAHLSLFGFFFPDLRRDFGVIAGNLLIVILFLSPLSKIFRTRLLLQLMGLRRQMGITFGYLVTVHGLGFLLDPVISSFLLSPTLLSGWEFKLPFFFGITAYMLTLPLLLTSNMLANRLLGRHWKQLHRIVYVMFGFVVLHRLTMKSLVPEEGPEALFQAILLVSSYLLLKLLAWRNFIPWLRSTIGAVSASYARYQAVPAPADPAPEPRAILAEDKSNNS